jgi:hypothetical protein
VGKRRVSLLGYNAVYSVDTQPMISRNMSPPPSRVSQAINQHEQAASIASFHGALQFRHRQIMSYLADKNSVS